MQLVMLTWCYLKAVFADAGTVPNDWRPPVEEETIWTSTDMRVPAAASRYCARCQHWKPPRCRHCSVISVCLKWIITVYG
ncbi:hypothetical protein LUZ60_006434 [Juncus effusus]|nr:hypothetical protein LUZ60_006434 [Juncus effusus]